VETTSEEKPADTSPVTRMVIPALLLDAKVAFIPFDGKTWPITGLTGEVAWLGDTSWPGLGGNTAFAGHVTVAGMGNGPFRYLEELPVGEVVVLYTLENVYTYIVRGSNIVDSTDLSVTSPTDNSQVTMITCVDWNEELEFYQKRLVVYADLERVDPVAQHGSR
jgi:LPXTG-site transpeptidase (sortase) family protein